GLKFLEAAHVKDVLAVLRIMENPRDEVSWFRVLQLLEGVGPAGARRLMDDLDVAGSHGSGRSPVRRLLAAPDQPLPASGAEDFERLRAVVSDCIGREDAPGPEDANGPQDAPGHALPPAAQIERIATFLRPSWSDRRRAPRA